MMFVTAAIAGSRVRANRVDWLIGISGTGEGAREKRMATKR